MFKIGFNYILKNTIFTTFSYLQTLVARATEHLRSSPWRHSIANFLLHLLKGMNLSIVEFPYTVFNENVIIIWSFFEIF